MDKYDLDQPECPQCGARVGDLFDGEPIVLTSCPHCSCAKCSCCDMGDGADCMACENEA